MVNNTIQHKKIFDIRSFVESSFGLPIIINYTWHEIYHELIDNKYKINSRFWNDNFNYMDHDRWHEILNDPLSKNKNYSMTQQLQFKVNAIDRIRKHFQNLSKDIFPNSANAISNEKFLKKHIPDDFNPIARIWYLFSKLSGTLQEFSSNQLVYDIPEFSIAKMNAGIISNLNIHPITGSKGAKRFYYTFELHGLSINMKISKNSWVRLIPFELRDISTFELYFLMFQKRME